MQETTLGQKFRVDAVMYCGRHGLKEAGRMDDLNATVNYVDTYRLLHHPEDACDFDPV
jgi:dihydroneopterin aldolase